MDQNENPSPLNQLPWIVWALALPIIAMELVFGLANIGLIGGPFGSDWRMDALRRFAFSPDLMRAMWQAGQFPLSEVIRALTYFSVHASLTHAVFAVVILLALSKVVAEAFAPWAVVAIFIGSGAGGALVFSLIPNIHSLLIGAYPSVYGMIGAYTFLLWVNLAAVGAKKSNAFSMIGMLLGIQLLFAAVFGGSMDWVAELSGFIIGVFMAFAFSPLRWSDLFNQFKKR
ncbi:MAG: rhomboid family intramembrane serine protease [Paracoccaceae bacterium]|jgi:membrane associated rhomboid family serine protease